MIKLFWNTHNQITPTSNYSSKEDVLNYNWGLYHKLSSDKWIFLLLNKVEHAIVSSLDEVTKDDVLIIIDSSIEKKKDFYTKLRILCSKLFLFHLGDETGIVNHSSIYDDCDYVWRVFCTNKYFNKQNLSCLPIGYKSGISYRTQKKDRRYKWNFIGTSHKSSRHDLLFQLSTVQPSFTFKTIKFNDKKIVEVNEMSEILSSTSFVPCPNGFVHPETYRLYEALECQCIPIIENTYRYYDRMFPENPFLKITKWLDAKKIIDNWSKEQIDNKRKECMFWWHQYKFKLQQDILKQITK